METEQEWYYLHGGRQLGPVGPRDLQLLAGGGSITPETKLWTAGLEEWVAASKVEGLFPDPEPRRPRLLTGVLPQAAQPRAARFGGTPAVVPAQPATFPMPGQLAPPGTEYPAPGPMKASFAWPVVFCILTLLTPVGAYLFLSWLSKDEGMMFFFVFAGGGILLSVGTPLVMAVFFGLFKLMKMLAIHRAWLSLAAGGARTTPAAAVGFLFIPFFGLFWMFTAYLGLAKDWNRIRASHPNLAGSPGLSEGLAGTCCVTTIIAWLAWSIFLLVSLSTESAGLGGFALLLSLVVVIFELIYLHGICRLVNYMGCLHFQNSHTPGA